MNELNIKYNRSAYSRFASLYHALEKYALYENNESKEELVCLINAISAPMPLPSGRIGNSLAVALEMNIYKGALFIIQNADELGVDMECVSSEFGGKNVADAQQTFEISKIGFETEINKDADIFYRTYLFYRKYLNDNIDAFHKIENIFLEKKKSTK